MAIMGRNLWLVIVWTGLVMAVDLNCVTCQALNVPMQDPTPPPGTVVLLTDAGSTANKKLVLLPDTIEAAPGPDIEFRIFQQKVLNYSELGALRVQENPTLSTVGVWAIRANPTSPWMNSSINSIDLEEFASVRLQEIHNPGLAQLTLASVRTGQTVVLFKFVMPLPLAARMQLTVEAAKIFSTSSQDLTNTPFIMVQDIFTVTMGPMPSKDMIDSANRSLSTYSQSKTLVKKLADFIYAATIIPTDLNPGVYLKPKSGYGLLATLEFRIVSDQGNSTKILYEQGDVYLHRRDQLRFVPKPPPPAVPAMPPLDTNLEFYVRCWDGTTATEAALGPIGDLRINFDNFFGQRPQLKVNASIAGIGGKMPTVPYKLDTDSKYQNGYSIGDLVEWFFMTPNQNGGVPDWKPWLMGMAVIATGTADLGTWQYKNSAGWHDFPDNLKTGWKLFKTDQSKGTSNGGYASTFTLADLKVTQVQVMLISPKLTIRFKPTKDDSVWSATDAFRQTTLSFLAWKPTNASINTDVLFADLDPPDCKVCNDMGISKEGLTVCAERFGCDGKLSSMMQMDQCDACGGQNECLDCRKVPRGNAKWICNVCTEDGSALKDCRGVCNGTYQRISTGECVDPLNEPKGCDGEYHSTAISNDCGVCVLGRTGKPVNYSKDQCGVCNGTNTCVGCDGQPNSGKVVDICGLCRQPSDDGFNKGCGARISDPQPKVTNIVNGTTQVNATGLSMTTAVDCWLSLINTYSDNPSKNVTIPVNTSLNSVHGTDLILLSVHWDYVDTPGVYGIRCRAAQRFDIATSDNGSLIYLVDYNILQLSNVDPSSIVMGDSGQNMAVKISGTFIPAITRDPYCLARDKKTHTFSNFPAEIRNSKEASCNLASIEKSKAVDLRIVQHPDEAADITARQNPMTVIVKARAPKLVSAQFGDAALEIVVKFDVNALANGDCQQIFDDAVMAKLGSQPTCRFSADQLHVTLGSNHKFNPNDTIRFKANAVYQADAEFYDYLSPDAQILLAAPDQTLVPSISIDSPLTVSMCSDQVRLAVRKATGDGGRAMTYQWNVIRAEKTSTKAQVVIPPELLQLTQATQSDNLVIPMTILSNDVSYIFNIIACNFLKECSPGGELRLQVGNNTDSQLIVQILGLDPPVRCGSKRQLRAAANMKVCDSMKPLTTGLVFHWEVASNQTVTATGNDWVFALPINDVEPGQQSTVKVQAFYENPNGDRNFTVDTTVGVTFEPQPLWVRLGATTRKQGIAEDLVLDGSASSDPNKKVQNLDHSWTCTRVDQATPCYLKPSNSTYVLFEELFNMNSAMVTVPANTFDAGVYNFTDTIHSGPLSGRDTVMVTLVPGRVPLVEMLPSLGQKPTGDQPITFRTNVYSLENMTVTLMFVETQGYGNVTLPEALRNRTRIDVPASAIGPGGYVFSFTLPPGQSPQYPNWTGLAPKTLYAARIVANTTSGLVGESFVSFVTNDRPTMGSLTMSTIPADAVTAIYALSTVLRLEAKGFLDRAEDLPLSYQFGIRTHMDDGTFVDEYFPASAVEELNIYLAAAESAHPSCHRVGYQSLVKVCDLPGACTHAVSPDHPFQVQQPINVTASIEQLVQEINTDLYDGNGFGASMKMGAIVAQKCGSLGEKSSGVSQAVAAHVLGRLTSASDKDDLVAATRITNDLLLRPNASVAEDILVKLKQVIYGLESSMGVTGIQNTTTLRRRKRQAPVIGSQTPVDTDSATQLLGAYEIIVTHSTDADSVAVYLKGTQDLLNQMCMGRDATQAPMIVSSKGSSQPLCVVEAQGLFIDPSIVNKNISVATLDQNSAAQFQIGAGLEQTYTLWPCNGGKSTCTSVCLATAVYFVQTDSGSSPVADYMFHNGTLVPLIVSNVHMAQFVDPISKESLTIQRPDWERFLILVPLIRNGASGYYSCKTFVSTAQDWTSNLCDTVGTKILSSGKRYVGCQCRTFGFIAVFESPPPSPPNIPPNTPVTVNLLIDQFDSTLFSSKDDERNATLQSLADRLNTSVHRIVDLEIKKPSSDAIGAISTSKSQRLLTFVLRPPSHFDHTDTNQMLIKMQGSDQMAGGSNSWQIVPQSMTYQAVKRDLKNDINNRLITIKILNDFDNTVTKGGAVALASTLTTQLAMAINISRTRITDMNFWKGSTMMSFIIQSLVQKSTEISAELAALILVDQIKYQELSLTDVFANMLILDSNGTTVQEIEKKAEQATSDMLPIIIGGTVGSAFFLAIVFVIALVVIKNRGRRDKVSPFSSTSSTPNGSQRNSAQTTVAVRRISITEDQNGSSLRARRS